MSTLIAQLFKHSNQRVQLLDRGGERLCGLEGGGGCLGNRNGTIGDIRKQMQKPHIVVMRSGEKQQKKWIIVSRECHPAFRYCACDSKMLAELLLF